MADQFEQHVTMIQDHERQIYGDEKGYKGLINRLDKYDEFFFGQDDMKDQGVKGDIILFRKITKRLGNGMYAVILAVVTALVLFITEKVIVLQELIK